MQTKIDKHVEKVTKAEGVPLEEKNLPHLIVVDEQGQVEKAIHSKVEDASS